MNNRDKLMNELTAIVNNGTLLEVSDDKLEEYFSAIIAFGSTGGQYFTPFQYPQVCEALRLLLMKKYTEKIDKQAADMQKTSINLQAQGNKLSEQNKTLQIVVVVLMFVTIAMAGLQTYVTLRPNSQLQEQIKLLQDIKLNLSTPYSGRAANPPASSTHQGTQQEKAPRQKQGERTSSKK